MTVIILPEVGAGGGGECTKLLAISRELLQISSNFALGLKTNNFDEVVPKI